MSEEAADDQQPAGLLHHCTANFIYSGLRRLVTELMTFGELSKWFAATRDPRVKSAVAVDLGLPTREALEGTLQLLAYIRNICAHHGRVWNRQTVKRLPYIKRFKDDLVVSAGEQRQPDNRVYNALVVLARLLRHQSSDTTFPARIRALIEARPPDQVNAMGFPEDWKNRSCWKI